MASGSFKSSVYKAAGVGFYRYVEVKWSSVNDAANNKSTITWNAYSRSPDSSVYNYVYAKNIVVTINGEETTVIGSTAQATYKDQKLGGGEITVSHSSNGTKSVNVSIAAQFYVYGATNSSYTGSITMSPNPMYNLSVSAGEGSVVTVNRTSCAGSKNTGVITSGTKNLYYGDTLKITFSPQNNYSVSDHKVNNKTFTSGNTHTVSGNVTVVSTATPLKSAISATNADIEGTSIISVTRYKSNYTHDIKYAFEGATGVIKEKTSDTKISWTIPKSFYAKIPDAKSGECVLTCETFNGEKSLGVSSCNITISTDQSKCAPSVRLTIEDINDTTTKLTGDSSVLIRYKSTAKCTVVATSKNNASIKGIAINNNIGSYTQNGSTTTGYLTYEEVNMTSCFAYAEDSRLYRTTVTNNPSVIKYIKPTCTPVIARSDPTSNTVVMTFKGRFYNGDFGRCSNILMFEYRYREVGGAYSVWHRLNQLNINTGSTNTYTSAAPIVLGDDFDYRKAYEVQIRVTDGGSVDGTWYELSKIEKTIPVKRGIPVFDWGEDDFNVNVALTLNNVNILDIIYPVGTVYMHTASSLPSAVAMVGSWSSIDSGINNVYAWKRTA